MGYYADHTREMRSALADEISRDDLRELHEKRPVIHFLVFLGLLAALAAGVTGAALIEPWYGWVPFSILAGFAIFNFTVMLHEVVHRSVFPRTSTLSSRLLGLLYAIPSGLSPSQFTRWHLDHHAELGSAEEDPKRHHLSPKVNARWLKLLYFTPALFVIYFAAARKEIRTYDEELRKRIAFERNGAILVHLAVAAALVVLTGWWIAFKVYFVPYLLVFPIAFALNRVGQHYDVDPSDPAKWATLIRASKFWDVVFLWSNYHLEHHYFPGVPLYNLPRLHTLLQPWYRKRGIVARSYGSLVWDYLVLNKAPHTDWEASRTSDGALERAI